MLHSRALHPVWMHKHRFETLFMSCPLDGEAFKFAATSLPPLARQIHVKLLEESVHDPRSGATSRETAR